MYILKLSIWKKNVGRILPVILFEFSEISVARFQVETGRLLSATMNIFLYAVNTL